MSEFRAASRASWSRGTGLAHEFGRCNRIAVVDLAKAQADRGKKLMPCMTFAGLGYAVGAQRAGGLIQVSLGKNPWSKSADSVNLGRSPNGTVAVASPSWRASLWICPSWTMPI